MSSCERTRAELVAFDRDELDAAVAAAVREHVASCVACATEQRKLRRAREMFARLTAVEPSAQASARLRCAVDAALVASRQETAVSESAAPRPRGMLRDAWEHARWRYERSATVRRFALASVGLHAAAAAILVALLARGAGVPDRAPSFAWEPDDIVTLPDGTTPDRARSMPAFDGMAADGVETASLPGRRFPNRTSAERWSAAMTIEGRRGAFRATLGPDDSRAEIALDRGLDWLAAMRRADGALPGSDPFEATSLAVAAFASAGRSTADDPGLGLSVDWIARRTASAAEDAIDVADRALATRALAAQFVTDFGRVDGDTRAARARSVATAARAVTTVQNADGGWGARPGAASDAASTVAAISALADVRACGVVDTASALAPAAGWLERRRSPDGFVSGADVRDAVTATARLASASADAGIRPLSPHAVSTLALRIAQVAGTPRGAAAGAEALAALGQPVRSALLPVLASQRGDGSWSASGRTRPADAVTETAWAAISLTRAFRR